MFETATLILIIVLFLLAACLVGLIFVYQKNSQNNQILDRTKERSYQLLHQTIKKAQEILSSAEIEGMKMTSDSKFFQKDLVDKLGANLTETSDQTQTILAEDVGKAESDFMQYILALRTNLGKAAQDYINYLNFLKSEADSAKNQNQETIRQEINQIFVKFEEDLSGYLVSTQQQSLQSIELELKSARQLIESYKQQQLKVIDENIIAMLEQTLTLVVTKKLTLSDQVDLVYEALEKAKAEKFII